MNPCNMTPLPRRKLKEELVTTAFLVSWVVIIVLMFSWMITPMMDALSCPEWKDVRIAVDETPHGKITMSPPGADKCWRVINYRVVTNPDIYRPKIWGLK